jgi:hypothetical protein
VYQPGNRVHPVKVKIGHIGRREERGNHKRGAGCLGGKDEGGRGYCRWAILKEYLEPQKGVVNEIEDLKSVLAEAR